MSIPLVATLATPPTHFEVGLEAASQRERDEVQAFTLTRELVSWFDHHHNPKLLLNHITITAKWEGSVEAVIRGSIKIARTETATHTFLYTSTDRIAIWSSGNRVALGASSAEDKVLFEFGERIAGFESSCLQSGVFTLAGYVEHRHSITTAVRA